MKILANLKENIKMWTGINCWQIINAIPTPQRYFSLKRDLKKLKSQISENDEYFPITNLYPCFSDKKSEAGSLGGYFWQDLLPDSPEVLERIIKETSQDYAVVHSQGKLFAAVMNLINIE
jgi:hypothetical protein